MCSSTAVESLTVQNQGLSVSKCFYLRDFFLSSRGIWMISVFFHLLKIQDRLFLCHLAHPLSFKVTRFSAKEDQQFFTGHIHRRAHSHGFGCQEHGLPLHHIGESRS